MSSAIYQGLVVSMPRRIEAVLRAKVDSATTLLQVVGNRRVSIDKAEADVFRPLSGKVVVLAMGKVDEDDVETAGIEDEVLGICFAEDNGFKHSKGGQIIFVVIGSFCVVLDITKGFAA
ncbi:hypothetical protein TNCV_3850221 [Trichonephila clavipes]|nr:hypothetical protein TNCV_3850221 [Trichonephila clavipes]